MTERVAINNTNYPPKFEYFERGFLYALGALTALGGVSLVGKAIEYLASLF